MLKPSPVDLVSERSLASLSLQELPPPAGTAFFLKNGEQTASSDSRPPAVLTSCGGAGGSRPLIWTGELMTLDPTKTYKVFHTVWYDGKTVGIFVTDLQFDEDAWYLVFEWTTRYEGEYPSSRFPIDPSLLVPSPDQGHDFLLQEPVEIPMSTRMTDLLSRHRKLRTD